jgi:protein phosphatase
VGDSRAYLVREGVATQLTKDQSLMQRLVDAGELTEEEAEHSERRNIILQALGPDAKIRVDLTFQPLHRGDILVICSDGLSGQVKREEIPALLKANADLDSVCSQLISLANERGGPDNITVVAARFDGQGLPASSESGDVGYNVYPTSEPDSGEIPALMSTPPSAPLAPPTVEAPLPARRNGSPAAMAAVGLGILAGLLALYFLLRR